MKNAGDYKNVTILQDGDTLSAMKTFGERFKEWRTSKNVSGWKIEKKVGFSRSNLSNMESGRYVPADDVLRQIATVPELEIDFLTLKSWKILEDYTAEEIERASEQAKSIRKKGKDINNELEGNRRKSS